MIKFGPSGFCEDFSKEHKSTEDIPEWLLKHNLSCYEISFTNGIRLSLETAEKYGKSGTKVCQIRLMRSMCVPQWRRCQSQRRV